jgi:hypothetical protein
MITNGVCVYCKKYKEVKVWKQTDEEVCYDCRLDLLDEEFANERLKN